MPYRIAVLGAGKLGRTHLRHWAAIPEASVVAVLDTHAEAAKTAGAGAGFTDFGALLTQARPDIVDICTPTPSHRDYVLRAAAAGKAIFVEKPLARTLEDCDAIFEAVERAGVPLMAGHVVRYFPAYRHAKALVDAGGVGTPAAIRAERLADFPHREKSHPWYADPRQSGGVVLDAMLHDFDWIRWCFGPVARVFAQGLAARPKHEGRLDYALVTLRLVSGAVAHLTGSWAHIGPMRTGFEIAGDAGLLEFDSTRSSALTLATRGGPGHVSESPLTTPDDPYYCELKAFVGALQTGSPPPVSVYDAREAVRIAIAALESIEKDQPVALA